MKATDDFAPAEIVASMSKPREGLAAIWSVFEIKLATIQMLTKWFEQNQDQTELFLKSLNEVFSYHGS